MSLQEPLIGVVVATHRNAVTVRDGQAMLWRCRTGELDERPVPGDEVQWYRVDENTAVVQSIFERRSLLSRPDPNSGLDRPMVANIDRVILVLAPDPPFTLAYVDRCLAVCEIQSLPVAVALNKTDQLSELNSKSADLTLYRDLGYPIVCTSAQSGDGLDEFGKLLAGSVSVMVGQSGVGKSSLTAKLCTGATPRIGELSSRGHVGRHTTTATQMHALAAGGWLFDSPGVRDFPLWHVAKSELGLGFREFQTHANRCKFRDCLHQREPGCAVQLAHDQNLITESRLQSYITLLEGTSS